MTIPVIVKSTLDSWNSVLSTSFTIFGAVLSVTTLIIAILLFDRFGVNAKFKDKQVDTVLDLATLLKKMNITATSTKMTYYVHATQSSEEIRNSVPLYKTDAGKTILFPDNFEDLIKDLYGIRDSYWFPSEIKNKMKIFEIYGTHNVDNALDDQYVRLDFDRGSNGIWVATIPKVTFEMLNINLHNLFIEIETWLKKHSDVLPNFKFHL
jgi:hypothetical protein